MGERLADLLRELEGGGSRSVWFRRPFRRPHVGRQGAVLAERVDGERLRSVRWLRVAGPSRRGDGRGWPAAGRRGPAARRLHQGSMPRPISSLLLAPHGGLLRRTQDSLPACRRALAGWDYRPLYWAGHPLGNIGEFHVMRESPRLGLRLARLLRVRLRREVTLSPAPIDLNGAARAAPPCFSRRSTSAGEDGGPRIR